MSDNIPLLTDLPYTDSQPTSTLSPHIARIVPSRKLTLFPASGFYHLRSPMLEHLLVRVMRALIRLGPHPLRNRTLTPCRSRCKRLLSRPGAPLGSQAASKFFSMASPQCSSSEKPVLVHLYQPIFISLLICFVYHRNLAFRTAFPVNVSIRFPQKATSGPSKETIYWMRTFLYIRLLSVKMARTFPMTTRPSGERMSPKPSRRRSTISAQSYES